MKTDDYKRILGCIPSSILVLDANLRVVYANTNFYVKSHKSQKEVLGRSLSEIFPQALLRHTHLEGKATEVARTALPIEGGQMEFRAPGLSPRIYYYSLTPLLGHGAGACQVLLLLEDITEQRRLGEQIRHQERHLASIVERADDIILSTNPLGEILTCNEKTMTISGWSCQELVGQPLTTLFPDAAAPKLAAKMRHLLKGRSVRDWDMNLRTKRGGQVPMCWGFTPIRDDQREVTTLVGIGRDDSTRSQLEAQLVQSAKMVSLGVMAGGIAHEIRNSLSPVATAAQLLARNHSQDRLIAECSAKISAGVKRTAAIIENLLDFARPAGTSFEPVNVNEALESTFNLIERQVAQEQIHVEKKLAVTLPGVRGNRTQLQQVFMNLILNAMNAMPNGGELTVCTRRSHPAARPGGDGAARSKESAVEIQFTDTGCGIPKEHQTHVFDPFFTTSPANRGTGLGLSVAYSIIKLHKGTISLTSPEGKGTTFTIYLPTGETRK